VTVTRYLPTDAGMRILADRATMAARHGVSEMTIRRHCRVDRYDTTTGAALYEDRAVIEALAGVRSRRSRTVARRR
jgi:hypothetical protein